jgi:hypothetical protein
MLTYIKNIYVCPLLQDSYSQTLVYPAFLCIPWVYSCWQMGRMMASINIGADSFGKELETNANNIGWIGLRFANLRIRVVLVLSTLKLWTLLWWWSGSGACSQTTLRIPYGTISSGLSTPERVTSFLRHPMVDLPSSTVFTRLKIPSSWGLDIA